MRRSGGDAVEPNRTDRDQGSGAVRIVIDGLRRAAPIARSIAMAIEVLAVLALAGGVLLWWLLQERVVSGSGRVVQLVLWAVLLAAGPAMLLTVTFALRQLAGLPEHLASLPERARLHASELGRLAREAGRVRKRGWLRSGWSVIRLWRTASASPDLLDVAAPAALLASPLTWIWALVAVLVAPIQVIAGVVALVLLLVS